MVDTVEISRVTIRDNLSVMFLFDESPDDWDFAQHFLCQTMNLSFQILFQETNLPA